MTQPARQLGRIKRQRKREDTPNTAPRHGTSRTAARTSARSTHSTGPTPALRALSVSRYLAAMASIAGAALLAFAIYDPATALVHKLLAAAVLALLALLLAAQRRNQRETSRLGQAYAHAHQLAELNSSVIASFAMAIDAKDQHTHGHTQRVHDTAVMIARDMGLPDHEIECISTAAMLHDIGKLAVPDHILSKPGQLTQEEMKKVKTHTLVGAGILESVKFPWPVVPVIRSHHEWYDGTGYPDAIAGDQIPQGARILAVADVYDALLSHRPYRHAMTVQEAIAFMRERSGTQFDPEILARCFRLLSSQQAKSRFGFIFDADGSGTPDGPPEATGQRDIFMDIRHAHQELIALYEVVQTMGQSLNMQETADLIMSKTKHIIDFATCVLFLHQPEDDQLVALAASGPYAEAIRG
ncbi:MAG: HD-GYP domain-containing protein, partial [Armatimonadota bacterium]